MKALLCILGISFALCGCHKKAMEERHERCEMRKKCMPSDKKGDRKSDKRIRKAEMSKSNNS
jgi:hypothetical protein